MSDLSLPSQWQAASGPCGHALASAFQPVFSLSHSRLVGHEALLRVTDGASGRPVPPNELFNALDSAGEHARLDLDCTRLHLQRYAQRGKAQAAEWLFLNVHPASLLSADAVFDQLALALGAGPVATPRVVIEVLESPHNDARRLKTRIEQLRALGCLIALDDFGAGHSNFERVLELDPHIVKLDRHVLLRAKRSLKARRILQRMVSLLHECGVLVLMEGIETLQGAHIALSCDVDFVQGYFYGRPAAETVDAAADNAGLLQAWQTFDAEQAQEEDRWRDAMAVHCEHLRTAAVRIAGGEPVPAACGAFLAARGATMCYLLDSVGRQVGDVAFAHGESAQALGVHPQFEPLHQCDGARWSRRSYFRRAVAFAGQVQLTRPYLTLQGGRMCFTASIAFEQRGVKRILCGDIAVGAAA